MKKLLFLLTFTFIGQQAFSQIYLITISEQWINSCSSNELTLTKASPTGGETHVCIQKHISAGALIPLNQELNSIISQGYKLIETSYSSTSSLGTAGLHRGGILESGTTFIFAIP